MLKIEVSGGWAYKFRKLEDRPIEMMKEHRELGGLGGWQLAKNFNLRALITVEELTDHFNVSEYEYRS